MDFHFLWKGILAGILMAVMIRWLDASSLPGLIGSVLTGGGAYLVIFFLLKGFSQQEIGFFRDLVVGLRKSRGFGKAL